MTASVGFAWYTGSKWTARSQRSPWLDTKGRSCNKRRVLHMLTSLWLRTPADTHQVATPQKENIASTTNTSAPSANFNATHASDTVYYGGHLPQQARMSVTQKQTSKGSPIYLYTITFTPLSGPRHFLQFPLAAAEHNKSVAILRCGDHVALVAAIDGHEGVHEMLYPKLLDNQACAGGVLEICEKMRHSLRLNRNNDRCHGSNGPPGETIE